MKVVLFHKNCHDGLFSAFSFWKKHGSKDTLFIEVNYKPIQDLEPLEALDYIFNGYINSPLSLNTEKIEFEGNKVTKEDMANMELFILDYSFPYTHLINYIPLFKKILVLDHHKTAIDEYTNLFFSNKDKNDWINIDIALNCKIIFAEKESGAKLTWMYFNKGQEVPDYIELISDRDLWSFKLENSRKFYYGLKLQDLSDFNVMDALLTYHKQDIVNNGGKYERVLTKRNEKIADNNFIPISVKIAGVDYKGVLVNTYLDIASDLCSGIIRDQNLDIAIAYNIYGGLNVGCSLRSKKGVDSSPLSLMYGGGGHAQASGFDISLKELNSIISNRFIIVHKKVSFLQRLKELFK